MSAFLDFLSNFPATAMMTGMNERRRYPELRKPNGARLQFHGIGDENHTRLTRVMESLSDEILGLGSSPRCASLLPPAMKAIDELVSILGIPPVRFEKEAPLEAWPYATPGLESPDLQFPVRFCRNTFFPHLGRNYFLYSIWETAIYALIDHIDGSIGTFLIFDTLSRGRILGDFVAETARVCDVQKCWCFEF
jgi:hypothetical protein